MRDAIKDRARRQQAATAVLAPCPRPNWPAAKDYVERVSLGQAPNTYPPASVRARGSLAKWQDPAYAAAGDNMPCPLSPDLADTAKWSCNAARHLTCRAVVTSASASSQLGQCTPAAPQNVYAGLSCRSNAIDELDRDGCDRIRLSFNLRSFTDRVEQGRTDLPGPGRKLERIRLQLPADQKSACR